jgi:hypothetical protein
MKAVSLFYPYIEPHAPGSTTSAMKQALLAAAIEFCEKSHAVQEVFVGGTTAGSTTLDIDVPQYMQLVDVISVQHKNNWLALVPTNEAPNQYYEPAEGTPTHAWMPDVTIPELALYPTPDTTEANVVFVRAAYAPTRSASQLADVLFEDWVEPIAFGAVARLQAQPGTEFTNPSAAAYRAAFDRGIAQAKVRTHRGRVVVSQRVTPRAFA